MTERRENPRDIWEKLSTDAQMLCALLLPVATSGNLEYLEAMATDFELPKAWNDLNQRETYLQVV